MKPRYTNSTYLFKKSLSKGVTPKTNTHKKAKYNKTCYKVMNYESVIIKEIYFTQNKKAKYN